MRKHCKNFEQWIDSQYQEFDKVYKKSTALQLRVGSQRNTHYATIFNTKTKRSVCETVNMKNGNTLEQITKMNIALAWASYKGEQIPAFYEPLISFYERDEMLFRYNCREWQIIQRHPYDSEKLICACENGEIKDFKLQTFVRRV